MRTRYFICLIAAFQWSALAAVPAQAVAEEERSGMRRISSTPFTVPDGTHNLFTDVCDFESGKMPPRWAHGHGEVVVADDGPQGKGYFRMKARKGADLHSPAVSVEPGKAYFISYWIKNTEESWAYVNFTSDEREPSFTNTYPGYSFTTADQWRQVGFYFWMPAQCKTLELLVTPREYGEEGHFIAVDDVRLRAATEAEVVGAYEAEKAHYPPYDITSRPDDGKNLALSVAKWEGRAGIPGKPFVIWAMGSSYTDWQGDGAELIQAIRQRFPNAPLIIYRKHGGPGTPWEFVHAWVKQFVAAEQPDLIFTYTGGSLEGLDELLSETRQQCTADIIVPSLHFAPTKEITQHEIEFGRGIDWAKVREICEKHGAEYVDNRRELAEYHARTGLDPEELLSDHNHQNLHGRMRIWDNVIRHLAKSDQSKYSPKSRERWIAFDKFFNLMVTPTEQVRVTGEYSIADGFLIRSGAADLRLKIDFTGNRIDLIGRKSTEGGTLKVLVDGVPGDQAPVFLMNSIMPNKKHLWRAPHAVNLGKSLVPQVWTITMTSDEGDYRVEGSISGPSGSGNLLNPFVTNCGQIGIDPKYWRQGRVEKKGQPPEYGVATGDAFTFDVIRGAASELSFKADQPSMLIEPIVRNLPNGEHTVELITSGDGDIAIEALYVYQPPEKAN